MPTSLTGLGYPQIAPSGPWQTWREGRGEGEVLTEKMIQVAALGVQPDPGVTDICLLTHISYMYPSHQAKENENHVRMMKS
jgi:hypothetical protein